MNDRCQENRELIAAAMTRDLTTAEQEALIRHVAECPGCRSHQQALHEDHQRMAEFARSLNDRVARLEDRMMESVNIDTIRPAERRETGSGARWGLFRSKPFRYAMAAVVVLIIISAVNLLDRNDVTGVVWAEVISRVVEVQDYVCRIEKRASVGPNMDMVQYCSSEYGVRQDMYVDGRFVAATYVVPKEKRMVVLVHRDRRYSVIELTDTDLEAALSGSSASEFVERFRAHDFEELGRRKFDGVTASGIETEAREFWGGMFDEGRTRLWVDVKTRWPMRLEFEGRGDGGDVWLKVVMNDFQWSPALTADDFAFEIPDDYTGVGTIERKESNEQTAIDGLLEYARLTGGQYPRRLIAASAYKEFEDEEPRLRREGLVSDDDIVDLMKIQQSCEFFESLQRDDLDPAYHGDRVDRTGYDHVLLRWRLEDGRYRVYYGDLRHEDVSAERLAEIEKD